MLLCSVISTITHICFAFAYLSRTLINRVRGALVFFEYGPEFLLMPVLIVSSLILSRALSICLIYLLDSELRSCRLFPLARLKIIIVDLT
jgi:hypothetical protein